MKMHLLGPMLFWMALGTVSCAVSPSRDLERMYRWSLEEPGNDLSRADLARLEGRRRDWIRTTREYVDQGALATDLDRLYAASLLLDSDSLGDLGLARDLALEAAKNGEDDGYPLAAEAIDRSLMKQGLPQRYGTQYVHLPEFGWVLYRWNEAISDAERRAMGVPTIAEALERLKVLNGIEDPPASGQDAQDP